MTATLETTAGPATAPAYRPDLLALAALVERHDALRARYIDSGELGPERWKPGSMHLAYHASLDGLCRAMIEFTERWGFTPCLD